MTDLLVVGDCNPDVLVLGGDVTPAFGQAEQLVTGISLVIGGSAAITAVAAARLGLRVALVAAVGDDPAGHFMLAQLASQGVDTSGVVIAPEAATGMTVALSRGDDRAILTATGAIATLTTADVPAGLLASARHLHVSSYFLMERSLGPGLAELFAAARTAGTTSSIDTNWDPSGRWGDEQLRQILAGADLLLPNEAEAIRLGGSDVLTEAAAALASGGRQVAVKLGARGAMCVSGDAVHCAAPPQVAVVDTTGAGDCFNAGLLAGLLRGMPLSEAMALGCAVGSASTAAAGGTGCCPDLDSALALASRVVITEGGRAAGG